VLPSLHDRYLVLRATIAFALLMAGSDCVALVVDDPNIAHAGGGVDVRCWRDLESREFRRRNAI
jgi:hypothetical protein